jgi:hypothetical protein
LAVGPYNLKSEISELKNNKTILHNPYMSFSSSQMKCGFLKRRNISLLFATKITAIAKK